MTFVKQRGFEILNRLPSGPVVGAEVGVWDGRLSAFLLGRRKDLRLYMVDRWCEVEPTHRYRQSNSQMARTPQQTYMEIEAKARKAVEPFGERAMPLKGESVEMARKIWDNTLDFVFVDADHTYEGCKEDIEAWYPKLKPNALLCGHDWDHPDHPGEWGVRQAVEEFAAKVDRPIETGLNRTWFLV